MASRRAVPMVSYEDVGAAIDWLTEAFGFVEAGRRFDDGQGHVTHAELSLDGATVFLGWPGPEYRGPRRHAEHCAQAARWLGTPWVIDGVQVEVGDVDAHYDRACSAGAEILREPEEQPFGRLDSAADPDGHRWMFMQPA
ncbi:MAG TPA: VOC family protein [Gaiellaceae bacterium]|nr:VOC family protein [Gaiellaceae bacterium]